MLGLCHVQPGLCEAVASFRIHWCPECGGIIHPIIRSHRARIHWRCVACRLTHWDEERLRVDHVDTATWGNYLRAQVETPRIKQQEFYGWQLKLALDDTPNSAHPVPC